MKKVSIIIPVYNLENTITDCIQSILEQSYRELEILIIDDGSKDNSLFICNQFMKKDDRISVYHHENHGVSFTRNRGIDIATGEYLMFVDGDDKILSDCVEHYVEAAESSEADVIIGGITFVDQYNVEKNVLLPAETGKMQGYFWELFCTEATGLYGYVPNKMYRLNLLKKRNVRFNQALYAQEDLRFAISAYDVSQTYYCISYSGYLYRYKGSRTEHPYVHYIENQIKLLKCAEKHCNISLDAKNSIGKRIASLLITALYCCDFDKFMMTCQEITNISGLDYILKTLPLPSFEIRLFLAQQYILLKYYLRIKKNIKRLFWR